MVGLGLILEVSSPEQFHTSTFNPDVRSDQQATVTAYQTVNRPTRSGPMFSVKWICCTCYRGALIALGSGDRRRYQIQANQNRAQQRHDGIRSNDSGYSRGSG